MIGTESRGDVHAVSVPKRETGTGGTTAAGPRSAVRRRGPAVTPRARSPAQCAPAPVRERTSSSAYLSASFSLEMHRADPAAEEADRDRDEPGFDSGNHCQSVSGNMDVGAPETTGEKKTRHDRGDQAAVDGPDRAAGVEPPPEQAVEDRRQVARGGDREGERHQERHVQALREDRQHDRDRADAERRDPGDPDLLPLRGLAPLDHVGVEVVRQARRRRQGQPGDHGEDGGEGDRGDDRQQRGPADAPRRRSRCRAPRPAAARRCCPPCPAR